MIRTFVFLTLNFVVLQVFCQVPPGAGLELQFDGSDKVEWSQGYSSLSFPFSFTTWVRPDTIGRHPIFYSTNRATSSNGWWVELETTYSSTDTLYFGYGDGTNDKIYKASIPNGHWSHIAISAKNNQTVSIYCNGIEMPYTISGVANSLQTDNSKSRCGFDSLRNEYFNGSIDELTFWTRHLSRNEIRDNMCRKLRGNEPGLYGYYRFDTPNSPYAYDYSNNNRIGSVFGAVRKFSSAPLGDRSVNVYNVNFLECSIISLNGDSIYTSFQNSQIDTNGLQLYIVDKKPLKKPQPFRVPPTVDFYVGVFPALNDYFDTEIWLVPPLTIANTYTASARTNGSAWFYFWGQTTFNNPEIAIYRSPLEYQFVVINRCPIFHILPQDTLACDSVQLSVFSKYDSLQWDDGSTAYTRSITTSGTYWFTAYDSISDCPATDTIEVTLLSDQTISVLPNDTLLCPGDSLHLDGTLSAASGYLWNNGDTTATLTVKDSGLYSVQVNIDSACFAYDSIRVSYSSFKDAVQDSSYVQCESDSVLVQLNPQDWQSATWSNGGTGLQTYFTEGGKYFVTATNYDGCSLTDTFDLEVISPGDSIPIFPDTTFCLSKPLVLKTPAGFTATWPNGSDSLYQVEESEAIKLLIGNGCKDTSYYFQATLENCSCQVKIPDAFTPNGDGLNDIFKPVTECNYLQYELSIFDRWGKKLFQTTETGRGFDGNFNNRELSGGVYLDRFSNETEHTARDLNGYFVLVR